MLARRRLARDAGTVSSFLNQTGASGYSWLLAVERGNRERKKTGVVENPQVLNHAGLFFDGPPGIGGLPFV